MSPRRYSSCRRSLPAGKRDRRWPVACRRVSPFQRLERPWSQDRSRGETAPPQRTKRSESSSTIVAGSGLVVGHGFAVADRGEVGKELHVDVGPDRPHGAVAINEDDDVGMEAPPTVFALVFVADARRAQIVIVEQRSADRLGCREAIEIE